jgi:hypothetical protein
MQSSIRIAALLALLTLAGCGNNPEALIIGQWKGSALKEQPETGDASTFFADLHLGFFEDSSCTFKLDTDAPLIRNIPTYPCTWMISEGKRLKLEVRLSSADTMVLAFFINIDDDRLEMHDTDSDETITLHRRRA